MDWTTFQGWLTPAALLGLCGVVWARADSLESAQKALAAKVDAVHNLMQTELRSMDVRIARIESHLWPRGRD